MRLLDGDGLGDLLAVGFGRGAVVLARGIGEAVAVGTVVGGAAELTGPDVTTAGSVASADEAAPAASGLPCPFEPRRPGTR